MLLVIEQRLPSGPSMYEALRAIGLTILAIVLSFLMVAIYWVAHHSMFSIYDHFDSDVSDRSAK
jgi:uncharacterized membrane protein